MNTFVLSAITNTLGVDRQTVANATLVVAPAQIFVILLFRARGRGQGLEPRLHGRRHRRGTGRVATVRPDRHRPGLGVMSRDVVA